GARPGSAVYLVGSDTGRDGIAGASLLASFELGTGSNSKRPSVQVGNPFLEKLLLEATLELVQADAIEAVQDLGAAGLTCATSEVAAKSGVGMRIDDAPEYDISSLANAYASAEGAAVLAGPFAPPSAPQPSPSDGETPAALSAPSSESSSSSALRKIGLELLELLASPAVASRRPIYRTYDQMVGTDTVVGPGADAAVMRIKGRSDGIALAID